VESLEAVAIAWIEGFSVEACTD